MKIFTNLLTIILFITLFHNVLKSQNYIMPEETEQHEGTWLQWPHHYTYGMFYRNSLDQTWVDMTSALISSEKVHIIAYNDSEKNRIINLLEDGNIPLTNIDFFIFQTDDVWIRDNGPIFVENEENEQVILDWGFNGWGNDAPYDNCDIIPSLISSIIDLPIVDLSAMVFEGGALEHDGRGTMMATRSSVTHSSRNPDLTEEEIEQYLTNNLGITKFLWLDGVYGLEITDMHIDGVMKFANSNTIVTMNNEDLLYWELSQSDIDILYGATDIDNEDYNFVYIPLTQNDVTTAYGYNLGYKGSYANYYIANTVVLVPNYNDPNDNIANNIIQAFYPNRTVVGIDVRNLYENGGMVHCVTQQQPIDNSTGILEPLNNDFKLFQNKPNPFNKYTEIDFILDKKSLVELEIYNLYGRKLKNINYSELPSGKHSVTFNSDNFENGIYTYNLLINNKKRTYNRKLVIIK